MKTRLLHRLSIEWSHFIRLPYSVRLVLVSYAFFLAAYPLTGIFTNAYLWRQATDVSLLITYNLGFFIGLPLGFYLNGILLKSIHVKQLYLAGALLQGVIPLTVVFSGTKTIPTLLIYGCIFGLGSGLYWANKNYLSLKFTKGQNRVYYNSLENIVDVLVGITVPFISGLLIVAGQAYGWYSIQSGYRITMLIAMASLTVSGFLIFMSSIKDVAVNALWIKTTTREWNLNRVYFALSNTIIGLNHVLPSIIVLTLLGDEGILGGLESVTAVLTAIALYIIGRKLHLNRLFSLFFWTWAAYLAAAAILAWQFNALAVIIYMLTIRLAGTLRFTGSFTVSMEVMDRQAEGRDERSQYAYVCDNELFFNIGRVFGIGLFSLIFLLASQTAALRFTALLIVAIQSLALMPIKKLIAYTSATQLNAT